MHSAFLPSGTVYGTLLNFQSELDAMNVQFHQAPYLTPPHAPILYIKPANTWSADGASIFIPPTVPTLEIGASIGMVIGKSARALDLVNALEVVAGYVLMNDIALAHTNFFRPPVKSKCHDGFCGFAPVLLPHQSSLQPENFVLEVRVNQHLVQTVRFNQMVRSAAQLLVDVTEFMTLNPGDVLMLGCDFLSTSDLSISHRPLVQAGDKVHISAPGFASLTQQFVKGGAL